MISSAYTRWRDTSERSNSWNPVCETYLKLKSNNSVNAHARVWPRRKVYQYIQLHMWMSILWSSIEVGLLLEIKSSWRADYIKRVLPSPGHVTCSRAITLVSLLIGLWNQHGMSLQPLTSIGCTYQTSLLLQSVAVKSGWFLFLGVMTCLWPIGLWIPH